MAARLETATPTREAAADPTVMAVLLALSFSHLVNDTMQSIVPSVYPVLKKSFGSISDKSV